MVTTVRPQCRHLCPSALHRFPPTRLPTAHTQPGPGPLLRNGAFWGALKQAKPAGHGRGARSWQSEDLRTASGNGMKDSPASQTWAASNSKPFSDSGKTTLFFSSANEPSPAWPSRRCAGAGAHSPGTAALAHGSCDTEPRSRCRHCSQHGGEQSKSSQVRARRTQGLKTAGSPNSTHRSFAAAANRGQLLAKQHLLAGTGMFFPASLPCESPCVS